MKKLIPVFVVVIIALVATVAILWQKISVLEKKVTNVIPSQAGSEEATKSGKPLAETSLREYAKDLSLNTGEFNDCLDRGRYADQVKSETGEGEALGVHGTPAFYINGRFIGGAFPFTSFKEVIDRELAGTGSANYRTYSDSLQKAYNNPTGRLFDPAPKAVSLGTSPVLGSKEAKVTIVEFADFECPFCAMFHTQAYQQIKSTYIDTGKVKFVFKQFPLTFHADAQKAAEASLCAGAQGKFWEFHDKEFTAVSQASAK